ncbi:hypothetical protein GUITHDRAFT_152698, partial [Guillardia theta CCMP2712]
MAGIRAKIAMVAVAATMATRTEAFLAPHGLSPMLAKSTASFKSVRPALRESRQGHVALRMGFFDAFKSATEKLIGAEEANLPNMAPQLTSVSTGPLTWTAGVSEIADPRHAMEDAWFAGDYDYGVFDGVTGAQKSEFGDLYSYQLSGTTYGILQRQREQKKAVDPLVALDGAYSALNDALTVGSSTACVVSVDTKSEPGYTILKGANVGDSGIKVVRKGQDGQMKVVYQTVPQMHYFNCPFQLGGNSPDTVDLATRIRVPLASGDIVIIASDGLYDNVYDSQIIDLLEATEGQGPNAMAQALVGYARQVQEDPQVVVPYGLEAQAAGKSWTGGKLDDTAAIVLQF